MTSVRQEFAAIPTNHKRRLINSTVLKLRNFVP